MQGTVKLEAPVNALDTLEKARELNAKIETLDKGINYVSSLVLDHTNRIVSATGNVTETSRAVAELPGLVATLTALRTMRSDFKKQMPKAATLEKASAQSLNGVGNGNNKPSRKRKRLTAPPKLEEEKAPEPTPYQELVMEL